MEKTIQYFNQPARVKCDEKCHKAWGINNRPRVFAAIPNEIFGHGFLEQNFPPELEIDLDDYAYLADSELPDAPIDPGTYEGGYGKPVDRDGQPLPLNIPNKWCVRECERCSMSMPGKSNEPLELRDFSKRIYNKPK